MTNQTIQSFSFEEGKTLSAFERDGSMWFIAADVCRALDIANPSQAVANLDDDEKGLCNAYTLGGGQKSLIVNESGLYSLIFRSRKESAQKFRKWVTSVVLPSIRKHGGYINGMEVLSAESQELTIRVVKEEAIQVGLRAAEEKEARSEALRFMGRGRTRRKVR